MSLFRTTAQQLFTQFSPLQKPSDKCKLTTISVKFKENFWSFIKMLMFLRVVLFMHGVRTSRFF